MDVIFKCRSLMKFFGLLDVATVTIEISIAELSIMAKFTNIWMYYEKIDFDYIVLL
jgi:hypothetical protein